MEVVILAGGLGTRLRSAIGNEIPKCMAPVAGKPFLWYILKYLTRYDVSRVVLSVGHLREVICKWIDDVKNEFPFDFDYAVENEPLGTGGGIRLALNRTLGNDVVVLNGDTFFDVDLNDFWRKHIENERPHVSIALKPMEQFERYGNVRLKSDEKTIYAFEEKKYCKYGNINGGVYIVNKCNCFSPGLPVKFSFEKDVLEADCALCHFLGFRYDGYFKDIGIPEDYAQANDDFKILF